MQQWALARESRLQREVQRLHQSVIKLTITWAACWQCRHFNLPTQISWQFHNNTDSAWCTHRYVYGFTGVAKV